MTFKVDGFEAWASWIDDVPEDIAKEVEKITTKSAQNIQSDAKWNTPIDTGRLEGSIKAEPTKVTAKSISAEIGTDVEYAEEVELGTSRQGAQPYLYPAFNKEEKKYKKAVKEAMNRGLD